jgi:hypothetical protein
MRVVGILNSVIGILSFCYFGAWLFRGVWRHLNEPPQPVVNWTVFLVLTAISGYFVVALMYWGIRLMKTDGSAIKPTAVLFAMEILFFIFYVVVFWIVLPLQGYDVRGHVIGLDLLAVQTITGYPVLGLLALLLLTRRRKAAVAVNH